ncbi:MAG: hypothetical protein L3J39_01605 [Verrucomicrobiales bacterium]|nr:hypothetical protein [Verrucomicrobiales bacterium]
MEEKKITADPLSAIMTAGTVIGICLLKNGSIVHENFPCSPPDLVKICRVIDGLTQECESQGRKVDQMAFGYDGGNLLAITIGDHRLLIMHLTSEEIDFLAKTARAYLKDLIAPPSLDENILQSNIYSDQSNEEDDRVEITADQQTFTDPNRKLSSNMSVQELVEYFAKQ